MKNMSESQRLAQNLKVQGNFSFLPSLDMSTQKQQTGELKTGQFHQVQAVLFEYVIVTTRQQSECTLQKYIMFIFCWPAHLHWDKLQN